MNVIARLEFELAYYDVAAQQFSHEDSPNIILHELVFDKNT